MTDDMCLRRELDKVMLEYANVVRKFDACRGMLCAFLKEFDVDPYGQPADDDREWHEWMLEQAASVLKKPPLNPMEQLMEWIDEGIIGIREFGVLYRNKMRRKHKGSYGDILGGRDDNYPGLMLGMFQSIGALEGAFELQHLRDTQMEAQTP